MGTRIAEDRAPDAPVLSGNLTESLRRHADQRARHFFFYLFAMQALVNYLSTRGGPVLRATSGLSVTATHQIDTGFRSNAKEYPHFDRRDAGVVSLGTSHFGRTDAAHFCNLGLQPGFVRLLERWISSSAASSDPIPLRFYELLKKLSGDTEQLPQQVNIGPDRVIDVMHGNLAGELLKSGKPVVSRRNVALYRDEATARMTRYRDGALEKGELGIAACADVYLGCYLDAGVLSTQARRDLYSRHQADTRSAQASGAPPPASPDASPVAFVDGVYNNVSRAATAECLALGSLVPGDFVV
jgi:hypothetical protein